MIVGIGVDLVHIARVERLLSSKGQRALERLGTEAEHAHAPADHDATATNALRRV